VCDERGRICSFGRLAVAAGFPKWVTLEIHILIALNLLPESDRNAEAAEVLVRKVSQYFPIFNADPGTRAKTTAGSWKTATVCRLGVTDWFNRACNTRINSYHSMTIIVPWLLMPEWRSESAAEAMELGADAVLVNTTAIAIASIQTAWQSLS